LGNALSGGRAAKDQENKSDEARAMRRESQRPINAAIAAIRGPIELNRIAAAKIRQTQSVMIATADGCDYFGGCLEARESPAL
jgi:hypothetical protein